MGLLGRRRNGVSEPVCSLFFATDIHGSERCFRKFINAGAFYGVDALIMGGDITGKTLVPIERTPRGWSAVVGDHTYVDMTERERDDVEQLVRDSGRYPVRGERDELARLADEDHMAQAFREAVMQSTRRWVELAEERLAGTAIRCFVTPGNDDEFDIDELLRGSERVEFVEGRRVALSDAHEMITTGYSNLTPWDSPRELTEEAMAKRLHAMADDAERPGRLVCVIHPPPKDSELDQAPAIDAEFRVLIENGNPRMIGVGSTAVRAFIERTQPLLGLHGHVHDSRAAQTIGRTVCINPGSQYGDGTLLGAIVRLGSDRVLSYQLVTG